MTDDLDFHHDDGLGMAELLDLDRATFDNCDAHAILGDDWTPVAEVELICSDCDRPIARSSGACGCPPLPRIGWRDGRYGAPRISETQR